MNKTLIVVDCQKDFFDKEGKRYIEGSEKICEKICEKIAEDKSITEIVLVLEWFKFNDNSFENCPRYCIQYTEGASVYTKILKSIQERNIPYSFFLKNDKPDYKERGAFEYQIKLGNKSVACFNQTKSSRFIFQDNGTYEICGIGGESGVWETYKNVKKMPVNITPLYDCIMWKNSSFNYEEMLNTA